MKKTYPSQKTFTSTYLFSHWFSCLLLAAGISVSVPTYAQDARAQNYLEQAEFEMAKSEQSVDALNRFIETYPASRWRANAEYERDRLAYTQAAQQGTSAAVQAFIDAHPDSAWLPNAHFMLNRLKKDETARRGSASSSVASDESTNNTPKEKPSRYKKPESNRDQDRVTRALSIYGDRRAEKQRLKDEKRKEQQEEAKKRDACGRLKDSIRRLGERVVWYNLDDQGNRQYVSDDTVSQTRERLTRQYQKECG
ncbi:tetratricopeptide repeat protein [Litoribrevibacter albus]|uniref:Outer membrane protein assembly factor BamD n=1 Tax=Litoribrevibacter albus TaxID=1473156 RepID=A0AA37W6N0_9GAMM|nr:hypothetical protein [Litoribrevibacter albus]GLQ30149.1 hypothetical protein GCM10007876_06270 [Litoribrevibacter albus]